MTSSEPSLRRRTDVPPRAPEPDAGAFLAAASAALALRTACLCCGCLVRSTAFGVGPLGSRPRRRWPPDADGLPLLAARLAHGALALASCRPSGRPSRRRGTSVEPPEVSSTTIPAFFSWSRIASAAAQSLSRARLRARLEQPGDERVDGGAQALVVAAAARAPGLGERVDPEHVEHGAHLRAQPRRPQSRRRRRARALPSRTVSCTTASACGTPRSSSIAAHERGRQVSRATARRSHAESPRPRARGSPRRRRKLDRVLLERLERELDHRAVVRGAEVVAQLDRAHARARPRATSSELPSDLLIFSPLMVTHALCSQYCANALAGRLGLRDLVLVVREDQVEPAAVDVERRAEVLARHRRALEVPAGTAAAPRRRPRGLARLGRLPQREVARVALAGVAHAVARGLHVVEPLARQRAVLRERAHVEVDVAVDRRRRARASMSTLHQLDHLRHVAGGPRLDRRTACSRARRTPRRTRARTRSRQPTTGRPSASPLAMILSSMSVTLRQKVTS